MAHIKLFWQKNLIYYVDAKILNATPSVDYLLKRPIVLVHENSDMSCYIRTNAENNFPRVFFIHLSCYKYEQLFTFTKLFRFHTGSMF